MKYYRAKDNAVGEHPDGRHYAYAKGDVLPEGHEIVQHDLKHGGKNWAPLPDDEPEPPKPAPPPRRAARAPAGKA